jgi:hypothetical protein
VTCLVRLFLSLYYLSHGDVRGGGAGLTPPFLISRNTGLAVSFKLLPLYPLETYWIGAKFASELWEFRLWREPNPGHLRTVGPQPGRSTSSPAHHFTSDWPCICSQPERLTTSPAPQRLAVHLLTAREAHQLTTSPAPQRLAVHLLTAREAHQLTSLRAHQLAGSPAIGRTSGLSQRGSPAIGRTFGLSQRGSPAPRLTSYWPCFCSQPSAVMWLMLLAPLKTASG